MLQLKIKQSNDIDQTGKLVYITDDTNGVGGDTITGYGAPNPERASLALFCIGYLIDSLGQLTPLSFETYDPLTVSVFAAKVPKDGRLRFSLVAFNAVQTPNIADYVLGDFVFSIDDYKVYQVVGNRHLTRFEEALTTDYLAGSAHSSISYEELFIANSSLTQIEVNKEITNLRISNESESNKEKIKQLKEQYDTIRGILQSAIYQFCIGNKYEASRYIEFLITNRYGKL